MIGRTSFAGFIFFLLFTSPLCAAGTTIFDFLRTDVGARAAALGGCFVTAVDDPNSIFYNPAGLASISSSKVSFGYFKDLLDVNAGYASYASQVSGLGSVGFGVEYTNYGSFQQTDNEGNTTGSFSAGDLALSAGFGGALYPNLHYGITGKYIYSTIAGYTASGAAADFGIQYIAVPGRILLGAAVTNVGTELNPYMTTNESLPVDAKIGMTILPEHLPATIMIDFDRLNDNVDNLSDRLRAFAVGVEFTASPSFSLRFGYNNSERQDLTLGSSAGLTGLSFGAGIVEDIYNFDYSFNSLGGIGGLHRISVGVAF
jgi:hypothetical protein